MQTMPRIFTEKKSLIKSSHLKTQYSQIFPKGPGIENFKPKKILQSFHVTWNPEYPF